MSTDVENAISAELKALESENAELQRRATDVAARIAEVQKRISTLNFTQQLLDGKIDVPVGEAHTPPGTARPRKGKSADVLDAIRSGRATTRADLLRLFNAATKTDQQSISNALTFLTKTRRIRSRSRGSYEAI